MPHHHSVSNGRMGPGLFRLLLLLYPREFREEYRSQLIEAYEAQRKEIRYGGFTGRLRFALEILSDTLFAAARRHAAGVGRRDYRIRNRQPGGSPIMKWGLLDMIGSMLQDVSYTVRNFTRNPGFTALVVLILAVGIGANVAMFSTMSQALIRPLPYAQPDDLVFGRATMNGNINPMASAYDYFDYRERNEVFESLGAILFGAIDVTVTGAEEPERIASTYASWDLFHTLGIGAQVGRHFSVEEGEQGGPDVVMISHGYWQRRFGGATDVVGRTMVTNGYPQTIVGIMPAGFKFLHDVDIWMPMRRDGPFAEARRWHNWLLVGRLRPGISTEQAQADVDVISAQLQSEYTETNRDKALLLTGLHEALVEDNRASLILLMAAVGLVLLIACGNVAGLLMARGSARRTELSVRAALGASSARLMRQLFTESVVTAAVAGILGTGLAVAFQRLIIQFVSIDLPGIDQLGVSGSMLSFALLLSMSTGLVFGILPALRAARTNVVEDIKSCTRTTDAGGSSFRSGLVVAQVAISLVLLIGSGLLIRSFATLRGVDPGFDTQSLLTAEIQLTRDKYEEPEQRINFYAQLVDDISAIPGVVSVGLINQLPVRNPGNNISVYAADSPPADRNDRPWAYQRVIWPGYFEAMRIPLLRGRGIERSDVGESPPVLVINETMAETLFPEQDPIGRQVVVDLGEDVSFEVIGVVGDVRMSGPRYSPRLAMYGSYLQRPFYTMRVAARTAVDPTSITRELRSAVWSQDSDIPVAGVSTMHDLIARSVSDSRVMAVSLTLFAVVAVSLAAVGLYGVLAFYVSRRVHEIGVRVALGAGAKDIVRLVLKRGVALVVAGIIVGLIGAYWLTRLLEQMLFGIEPTDPTTFVAVSLFYGMIALIACLIPAWKALRVDPLTALQAE